PTATRRSSDLVLRAAVRLSLPSRRTRRIRVRDLEALVDEVGLRITRLRDGHIVEPDLPDARHVQANGLDRTTQELELSGVLGPIDLASHRPEDDAVQPAVPRIDGAALLQRCLDVDR